MTITKLIKKELFNFVRVDRNLCTYIHFCNSFLLIQTADPENFVPPFLFSEFLKSFFFNFLCISASGQYRRRLKKYTSGFLLIFINTKIFPTMVNLVQSIGNNARIYILVIHFYLYTQFKKPILYFFFRNCNYKH